jgi:hypothetical protein
MGNEKDRKKMRKLLKSEVRLHTIDQLAWMPDDDLMGLYMTLDRDRENVLSMRGKDVTPIEIELCYVQRELDIRNTRRRAHSQWLVNLGAEGIVDAKSN